jgi:hypothetical protein
VRFQAEFAAAIRSPFPGCPPRGPTRWRVTRRRAAAAGSGEAPLRGAFQPDAVHLAVAASVRHLDTNYDQLLMSGVERAAARDRVRQHVEDVLGAWREGIPTLDLAD